MTPLTHAAVGAAFYRQLRKPRWPRWAWLGAFPLAFLSHYALDAIPHFEDISPQLTITMEFAVMVGLGLAGALLALLLMRWDREAGRIWLVLSIWLSLGPHSFTTVRLLAAGAAIAYIAWSTKDSDSGRWSGTAYLLAMMVSIAPDMIPNSFIPLKNFHDAMHYGVDWATRLHRAYSHSPIPAGIVGRLHDGYFVIGYILELGVEACVFFTALYLCTRKDTETAQPAESEPVSTLELSPKN